jgi:hypothetical protein
MPTEKAIKQLSKRTTADIHEDFLQPSGSTVVKQVVSTDPRLEGSGSTLHALEGLATAFSETAEKQPKPTDRSSKGSVKVEISTDGS